MKTKQVAWVMGGALFGVLFDNVMQTDTLELAGDPNNPDSRIRLGDEFSALVSSNERIPITRAWTAAAIGATAGYFVGRKEKVET